MSPSTRDAIIVVALGFLALALAYPALATIAGVLVFLLKQKPEFANGKFA